MTIFNISLELDGTQPRTEPRYTRPRKSGRLKAGGGISIRSPRLLVDVDLTVSPGVAQSVTLKQHKENLETEVGPTLGTTAHTKEQIVLTETEDLMTVSRLSKPVWPKSSPTIPSTLFKNDFQSEVNMQ